MMEASKMATAQLTRISRNPAPMSVIAGGVILACLLGCAMPVRAENVPQFRGVGGLGISQAKDVPLTWNDKENIRWRVALPGRGLSSPVISAGRVYLTACTGAAQKRLHVLCFDEGSGKQLWERQFWATATTLCHP